MTSQAMTQSIRAERLADMRKLINKVRLPHEAEGEYIKQAERLIMERFSTSQYLSIVCLYKLGYINGKREERAKKKGSLSNAEFERLFNKAPDTVKNDVIKLLQMGSGCNDI